MRQTEVWEKEEYLAMHIQVSFKRILGGIDGLTDGAKKVIWIHGPTGTWQHDGGKAVDGRGTYLNLASSNFQCATFDAFPHFIRTS